MLGVPTIAILRCRSVQQAFAHTVIHQTVTVSHHTALEAMRTETTHAIGLLGAFTHGTLSRARLHIRSVLHRRSFHEVRRL